MPLRRNIELLIDQTEVNNTEDNHDEASRVVNLPSDLVLPQTEGGLYIKGTEGICNEVIDKKTRASPQKLASPSFAYTEGVEGICNEGIDKKTRTVSQILASPSSFAHIEGVKICTEGVYKKTRIAL
ncbi:hypothetical protein LguiA_002347 [Lonicera macranthoides]